MKTIEEKATAYALENTHMGAALDTVARAYIAGAFEALAGQWHYTRDEDYPQCDHDVLVAYKSRYSDTILYGVAAYDDGWYSEDDSIMRDGIFAWMRIPELQEPKDI